MVVRSHKCESTPRRKRMRILVCGYSRKRLQWEHTFFPSGLSRWVKIKFFLGQLREWTILVLLFLCECRLFPLKKVNFFAVQNQFSRRPVVIKNRSRQPSNIVIRFKLRPRPAREDSQHYTRHYSRGEDTRHRHQGRKVYLYSWPIQSISHGAPNSVKW